MLIFWLFFILADKISWPETFWTPIQNLNSVVAWEIPHLNWMHGFVRFSRNFCQNAWTSSLCGHVHTWKLMFFGSAQRSCEHERHMFCFITSIREYPPYWKFRLAYFTLGILQRPISCGPYPFNKPWAYSVKINQSNMNISGVSIVPTLLFSLSLSL